ncbi:MAG: hypothetical protein ACYDCX_12145 [Acidithiobacillus sp.]
MNDDDLLGGLNDLVNQADKKPAVKPVQKQAQQVAASPVEDDILSQQILERLDGIRASIDGLKQQGGAVPLPQGPGPKNPEAKPPRPPAPPKPSALQIDPVPQPIKSWWPYLVLVSAALELAAFALGMGYGAIVASGKFPFWYKPGASGALVDWIAAPAGVLLLPIIAALLAMGGRELQREGHDTVAKALWAIAGGLAVISALVPFIA